MFILSLDFGTSSVKIAILNEKTETVQKVKKDYKPRVIDNDKIEIDPELVFDCLIKGVNQLDKKYLDKIEIIAFSVFSPSLVTLDRDGNSLYPCILHLDRRSRKQSREIIREFGRERFKKITGVLPFAGGVSITSLLWLKENIPEVYNRTYKFGHFNTYICKKLTGKWAIDPVNASMTGLYETTKWGNWSKDICNTFGFSIEKLPEIIEAGTIMGGLKKEPAVKLGLQEGLPVILGSNDAATAILGAGLKDEGDILNIAGSNEIATILTEKPVVNDAYYLRNSLYRKKWQIFGINIGGFAIEWFRKVAFSDMKRDYFYNQYFSDLIQEKYEQLKSGGFTVGFKPYLAGDRHSLEEKRGIFSGLTMSTTRDDMLFSVLLGINEPIINIISLAREFLQLKKTIIITGGLAETSYLDIKHKLLTDFDFTFKSRCTTVGNGKLALQALGSDY